MKKTLKIALLASCFLLLASAIFPAPVFAHNVLTQFLGAGYWGGNNTGGVWTDPASSNALISCDAAPPPNSLIGSTSTPYAQKVCDFCELLHTFQHFIYFGLTLIVYAAAPVLFAVGGLFIILAGGSPERQSQGRKIITGTVWGLAIALAAWLIVDFILKTLGRGGFGNITCT